MVVLAQALISRPGYLLFDELPWAWAWSWSAA